jgi:predicted permease
MAKSQDASFLILLMLIILSILIFFRNGVYLIFDRNFLNLEEYLHEEHKSVIDYFLSIFAAINFFLAAVIVLKRNVHNDILTYGLFYVMFSSILRLYVHYLKITHKDRELNVNVNTLQDVNGLLLFLISGFILANIFLKN